jgi:hypothetical protein
LLTTFASKLGPIRRANSAVLSMTAAAQESDQIGGSEEHICSEAKSTESNRNCKQRNSSSKKILYIIKQMSVGYAQKWQGCASEKHKQSNNCLPRMAAGGAVSPGGSVGSSSAGSDICGGASILCRKVFFCKEGCMQRWTGSDGSSKRTKKNVVLESHFRRASTPRGRIR